MLKLCISAHCNGDNFYAKLIGTYVFILTTFRQSGWMTHAYASNRLLDMLTYGSTI